MKNFYEIYGINETSQSPSPVDKDPVSTVQYSRPDQQWLRDMYGAKYNKDELNYTDYQKIKTDPQVALARRLIMNYLLSKDYTVTSASQKPEDIKVAEWVESCFQNMDMSMKQVRQHLYTAMDYGYAVSEIVYKINPDNTIGLSKIKGMQIETLRNCFKLDELGEVTEIIQKIHGYTEPIMIPSQKCMIYTFEGEECNPYGTSLLKGLNDTVFFKDKVFEYLAIFLQKHGAPTLAAKVGHDGDPYELLKGMSNIIDGSTAITHGAEDQIYVVESSKDGKAFFDTLGLLETLILRVFLIGSLVLGQVEAGGSYAQSQTHMDALKLFLDGVHEDLSIEFQNVIQTLVDLNFNVTDYPSFQFEEFNELDLVGLLNALLPYADRMLLEPEALNGLNQLIKQVFDRYGDITIQEDIQEEDASVKPEPPTPSLPAEANKVKTEINWSYVEPESQDNALAVLNNIVTS